MRARDSLRVVGVFVLVVAVVVGGTGIATVVAGPDGRTYTSVEADQFQPATVLPGADDTTGTVEMTVQGEKTVVVDMAHDNAVDESDLEPLTSALVRNGHEVRVHSRGDLNASLRRADAYVIATPRTPFTADEVAGLRSFVDAGGRLLLLSEPPKTTVQGGFFSVTFSTIGDTHTSVSSGYGLSFGDGYLYELSEERHFKSIPVEPTGEADLVDGVDRLVFREAVPVTASDGATVVASDADETTLSTTRRAGDHAVVARSGGVVAVGDTDFLRSENAAVADNEVFVGNLADFLVSGEKTPGAPQPPEEGERDPGSGAGPRPAPPSGGSGGDGGGESTPAPTPAPA